MASGKSNSLLKGRWTIWILSLVFSLLAGFGVLTIIGTAAEQGTYYVVSEDVPARTLLEGSMIEAKTANIDGIPATAISLEELQNAPLYTKIPLATGDPLTITNIGPITPIYAGLPENYVVASLAVSPENAAGGRIGRGDYVDIAGVYQLGEDTTAKIVLHNVLVLDVTVAPDSIAQAAVAGDPSVQQPGVESQALRSGIPQLYTFAVSPDDFVKLALLRDKNPYLSLSKNTQAEVDSSITEKELFAPGIVGNSGAGTENTIIQQDEVIEDVTEETTITEETQSGETTVNTPVVEETLEATPTPTATP
jgi:Flp pilus assembly protein CpaB